MKKLIILLSAMLFNFGPLFSMKRELSCIYNKMSSLVYYFKPSVGLEGCYVEGLPLEVQGTIIKNLFSCVIQKECIDWKSLERHVLAIPLELGCKFIGEFVQMQKNCENKICNKTFLPQELFCLPKNERDVFIRMANRSLIYGGNIDVADYEVIEKMSRSDIKKGLHLEILPDDKVLRLCEKIKKIGLVSVVVGVSAMLFCLTKPSTLLCKSLAFTSLGGIFGGYGLGFSSEGALYLYNKFYCDEEVFIKKIRL